MALREILRNRRFLAQETEDEDVPQKERERLEKMGAVAATGAKTSGKRKMTLHFPDKSKYHTEEVSLAPFGSMTRCDIRRGEFEIQFKKPRRCQLMTFRCNIWDEKPK